MTKRIEGTEEAWETRELGADEDFVKAVPFDDEAIDGAIELKMISIRLPQSLLAELKMIAQLHGLGYQPLMKQVLKRFVECEKKQLLREISGAKRAQEEMEAADMNGTRKAC